MRQKKMNAREGVMKRRLRAVVDRRADPETAFAS
jgi:hypothetical protein